MVERPDIDIPLDTMLKAEGLDVVHIHMHRCLVLFNETQRENGVEVKAYLRQLRPALRCTIRDSELRDSNWREVILQRLLDDARPYGVVPNDKPTVPGCCE